MATCGCCGGAAWSGAGGAVKAQLMLEFAGSGGHIEVSAVTGVKQRHSQAGLLCYLANLNNVTGGHLGEGGCWLCIPSCKCGAGLAVLTVAAFGTFL